MAEPHSVATLRGPVDLEGLVRAHFSYIWRLGRRLGLSASEADDVTQQVFLVAVRRMNEVGSGNERAFLYGTAVRCAAKWRRSAHRRREELASDPEPLGHDSWDPEQLLDRRRAREVLDHLLEQLPIDLRVVFVLYEIEQLTTLQIAELLEIPQGTVSSRLRRARADFSERVARLEARRRFQGVEG